MVLMIGAFPPPVHGMANVNKAMRTLLGRDSGAITVVNIAASSLDRSLRSRLQRVCNVLLGIPTLLRHIWHHDTSVYMSISGGSGQLYEALYILLAKLFSPRLYLHHHSFAYLGSTPSATTTLLTRIAGPRACHICLSATMAQRLRSLYPAARNTLVLSNVVFLGNPIAAGVHRQQLASIGYLSNISEEKGIFHYLAVCRALHEAGSSIACLLAGPFQDAATEAAVRAQLSELPNVRYIGPVYGSSKEDFFNSIDALLFPTTYPNEAEPLTILEALARSVPVIAYGRGAIPEILAAPYGVAVDPGDSFAAAALAQLAQWQQEPTRWQQASQSALDAFHSMQAHNRATLDQLISTLTTPHT